MNPRWTKYKINGESVCSQLTDSQYRYFLKEIDEGKPLKQAFEVAKKRIQKKAIHRIYDKQYWDNPAYENKIQQEIKFFQKEIAFYQQKYKKRFGKEYTFFLPVPLDAKPELEVVILATRCGALILALEGILNETR